MNFELTDEQQLIVDTVRSFVENELYPHEEEVERTGVVPKEVGQEIAQKCKDIGFYASNISTDGFEWAPQLNLQSHPRPFWLFFFQHPLQIQFQ